MSFNGDATRKKQDDIIEDISDVEAKLDSETFGLEEIKSEVVGIAGDAYAIEAKLDSGTYGLSQLDSELGTIIGHLTDATYGLSNIKDEVSDIHSDVSTVISHLTDATYGLSNIKSEIAALSPGDATLANQTIIIGHLTDATYGLSEIKSEIGTIDTEVGNIEGKLDSATFGLSTLEGMVDDIEDHLTDATYGLSTIESHLTDATYGLSEIKSEIGEIVLGMDFWSDLDASETINTTAADVTLPQVTVDEIPSGATFLRAYLLLKFRTIENTCADENYLVTAQYVQIKADGDSTYTNAILLPKNLWTIDGSGEEGGDCIVGAIDIAAKVDANDIYDIKIADADVTCSALKLCDIQTGIKVYYSL